MEKRFSLFQEISNMQMNKEEEVPHLTLSGCLFNFLIPIGSCQNVLLSDGSYFFFYYFINGYSRLLNQ